MTAPAWRETPAALGALIPGLLPATIARLFATPALADRAHALLAEDLATRCGPPDPAALAPADRALVLASSEAFQAAAAAAAAVLHAPRVRALLRGADIAAFVARFGAAAHAAALREDPPAPPIAVTGDLVADVDAEMAGVIAAWIADLPPWAAARQRLLRPSLPAPSADGGARAALLQRLAPAAP